MEQSEKNPKKQVYYLIYLDTFDCVNFEAIVGIAESWREVLELLGNYFILQLKRDDSYTIESDTNDIQVRRITKKSYDYLENVYKKNDWPIGDARRKYFSDIEP